MKVVVISAHPDDEILGVGGTLLRHRDRGDEIGWLIFTNISTGQGYAEERVIQRQREIETIAARLNVSSMKNLEYPTTRVIPGLLPEIIPQVADFFHRFQPERLFVLNRSDAHSDHRIVFEAVMACTKTFRFPFIKQVLMYETLSETEFAPALHENVFIPNFFVDITPWIEQKIELMGVYESEMGPHPFPRSAENIRALAAFRGATAGVPYAEAFQLLKWVEQ